MADFNLTKMAVNIFCPGNVVQTDDAGLPSLLVYIPAFKLSDVLTGGDDSTHPAFIVNGKEIPGFYYSKYQNVVYNGKAYSLPGEDPAALIKFNEAQEYCEAKGYGWHLSTAAEWAAIALWCKKNGFLPYGNNKYGADSDENEYKAIPASYTADGLIGSVATGSGPLTWSHDRTLSGIWDMNGNVWEWQGGLRLVWGELQILANNDAADPDNPQNETSTRWKAINAFDGSLVEPECTVNDMGVKTSGSTVKLDYINEAWIYNTGISSATNSTRSCDFSAVACADGVGEAAKALLRSLALLPEEGATPDDYKGDRIYVMNGIAERCFIRGGTWATGVSAGIFCSYACWPRDMRSENLGFRAAYIPNI